jgi:hypothetical protein
MAALKLDGLAAQGWPAVLAVGGAVLLFLAVGRPGPVAPAEPLAQADSASSVMVAPAAPAVNPSDVATPAAAPAAETPVDIYALLAEQPKDEPAAE